MEYKAGLNPDNPKEFIVSIKDFPEGTEFNTQALKVTEGVGGITHLIVTTNSYVKKAQFSYGYHSGKGPNQPTAVSSDEGALTTIDDFLEGA